MNEIVKNADGTVNVTIMGDDVWENFSEGIRYVLNDNDIDPSTCHIIYEGTFGNTPDVEEDEWLTTVEDIFEDILSITFDTPNYDSDEIDTINYAIEYFNLPKDKIKFRK